MRTYVVEAVGVAIFAFRAENDAAAKMWLDSQHHGLRAFLAARKARVGPLADPKNTLEVRAATVAEQEAWIENAAGLSEDDYDRDDLWVFLLRNPTNR